MARITEREVVAALAEELNRAIEQGGTPFEKASVEHKAGTLYPDIVIWQSYSAHAFAFWELKAPGLQEDLSKLPSKAQELNARYAVVWNFQHGELYEVERGQLSSCKSYPTPLLDTLEEWAIPTKRIPVLDQARKILDDLARLARGESLMPFVPDEYYFIGILQEAIRRLVPALTKHLQSANNRDVRGRILAWAVKQGYPTILADLDDLLAHHWAYSLAVRILFYFTVRRYRPGLPDPQPAPEGGQSVAALLQDAFAKAQAVDWQAIFEPSPLDRLGFPEAAEPTLCDLLAKFHRYDFSQLKEDVIGRVMEGLIPEGERHALGQYFTPEDLADFIIGFVADCEDRNYLDPTCGSGTFLNRLYSRLRWLSAYKMGHADLLERLWGVDIAHFPAELATINLFRQNVHDITNFPRIVVQDFFRIRPGQTFFFPPMRLPAPECSKIEVPMPPFHGIVGNFPYIRQELIERQNKGYKQEIVTAIAREWFWRDRDLFEVRGILPQDVKAVAEKGADERDAWLQAQVRSGRIDLRLSGQADIYAYLFYYAAAFLEEGGRLGIVTSNAWLDVAYGEELKRFFLKHFKIVAIVASWVEPWFEDAAVNTAFTILERCEDPAERARNVVRFVKVRRPLRELLPRDLLLHEGERWQKVEALVREIETADAQLTSWDPSTGQIQPLRGIHAVETDAFRIRLVPQAELEAELQAKGPTAKWGLYIRAPQVYFDLLREAGEKFVPLSQVAEVRRGYTTGINEFFYLEPLGPGSAPGTLRVKNARGWVGEIEEECLKPVIKSPKEATGLVIDPTALKYRLFLPPVASSSPDPERELRTRYPLAYAYTRWGEVQRTPAGQPWPQVPSVQGRRAWWLLTEVPSADVIWVKSYHNTFREIVAGEQTVPDQRVYAITFSLKERKQVMGALLNSCWIFLETELKGRVNLGDGALDTAVYEVQEFFIQDPSVIPDQALAKILKAFHRLKERGVKPIAQEVKRKDRRALDTAVLEALGLDPQVYLPRIYQGLVEMVEERLALPKLRATRKKGGKRLSREHVKEQVRQEVLPGGLMPITAFWPAGPKPEMISVSITGRPVSWRAFFDQLTLCDAEGKEVGMVRGGEKQARYAVYAAQFGRYMLEMPADPIVVGKAVQGYEHYLREVGQGLFQRALEGTRNRRDAERVTREILESLDLPPLAVSEAMKG